MKKKHTFPKIILAILFIIAVVASAIYISSLTVGDHKNADKIIKSKDLKPSNSDTDKAKSNSDSSDSDSKTTSVSGPTSIIFTGDVNLNQPILSNYDSSGLNGVLSSDLQNILKSADILIINNEFSFSTRGEAMAGKEYTFRVPPSYVSILTEMGVDVAGVANNHALDYGKDAYTDTLSTLHSAGISTVGGGNSYNEAAAPAVLNKNGETFAILASSRVIPSGSWNIDNSTPGMLTTYDPNELIAEIKKAKASYNHVLVEVHWGKEYADHPEDYQVDFAHKYIDAGADAVIGMHPHVLQGIEFYKGKPIFYSLGNFMFFKNTNPLAAVKLNISGDSISCHIIPAYANNSKTYLAQGAVGSQESSASSDQAESVYAHLRSISTGINIDSSGAVTPAQ
jgi:poly-gamma-glutamate synthesis protein (capsule biosynthesis protein)